MTTSPEVLLPPSHNLLVHTVLVRPIYSRNIGQAVRATMNMGFGKVFIINSQCSINSEAYMGAAGAQKALKERIEYKSWEDFNVAHKNTHRIALTRRIGKQRKPFTLETGLRSLYTTQLQNTAEKQEVFLIFGPEDHGLSSEDLDHVNICCHLPVSGPFKSLNLAQAVLLAQHLSHEIYFKSFNTQKKKTLDSQKPLQENHSDFFPDQALLLWLESMGAQVTLERRNSFESIKKMILRGFPNQKELSLLEKTLRQSHRKQS